MRGNISNVTYYNRALSAAEILQNYNALLPRFYSIVTSGLVLNLDAGNPNSYSPPRSDQYASSLVLAVPMNGANNGTTFTDQSDIIKGSGSAKAITRNGDTKTLTAQSKFYGSSGFFDGTGDNLSISAQTDFAFGTGDFTIECWVYQVARTTLPQIAGCHNYGVSADWLFSINSSGALYFQIGSSGAGAYTSTSTVSLNSWTHVSLVRQSGTVRAYINGVDAGGSVTYSSSISSTINFSTGGANNQNSNSMLNGYLQDLRIYKGVAKYTTNFKPSSISSGVTISSASGGVPILNTTDDYGTVNGSSGTTWTDISGNGNNGTLTNGPTYNGANYGSIVFDGGDDYVTLSNTSNLRPGTGDFTIEAWIYKTGATGGNAAGNAVIYGTQWSGGSPAGAWILYANESSGTKISFSIWSTNIVTSTTTILTNQWYHIAVSRIGTTVSLYINNVLEATATSSANANNSAYPIYVGLYYDSFGFAGYFNGRIPVVRSYIGKGLTAAEISQNFNATKWRYGI
jgi:hypothetical protein